MALALTVGLTVSACQGKNGALGAHPRSSPTAAVLAASASAAEPGRQTGAAPAQSQLSSVRSASLTVPAKPFGLVYARTGHVAFVALKSELGVLSTSSGTPRLVRTIPLPAASLGKEGATGVTLTHDGRELLIAAGGGAIVVDAAKAASGAPGAVLGTVTGTAGTSAIEVTVSPDDHYAFVSQEYGNTQTGNRGDIEVFDLHKALHSSFGPDTSIGSLTLGNAVVGTAISPNGRWLYATSEIAPGQKAKAGAGHGDLSIIDLATLESTPTKALLGSVPAGCDPVRVAPSPDGKTVWVTARQSNALLAFDAAKLTTDPQHAMLTSVQVGTAPVGLTFVKGSNRIITADSDRFHASGATTGLTVVDTQAALAGKPANLGRIQTGAFPREFALSPDGKTLLVSDYDSKQIQAIATTTLP
ncbi:YncE family protein [Streptantibioticus ferralitis]|uniref:YncE family protein n=1 Tax=Streptantibioticus ferralitis TaxID=236510 RepID=A0ABT5ZDL5_9ACTN|nr:YncE family protein [Streptantibioticus ferralitis]MDF2261135.1 YncE family protein [Streptantibioticus ferralitis]